MKPWKPREDRYASRLSAEMVATITGRSITAVRRRQKQLARCPKVVLTAIGRSRPRKWASAEDQLVLRLPATEVARLLGRSRRAVAQRRRLLNGNHQQSG